MNTLALIHPDLLNPISQQDPSGLSVRYSPSYDRIKEARREEDTTLPQGVWEKKAKRSDWDEVEKLCLEILTKDSKDLRVVGWLLEAWGHLYKLEGLERGMTLLFDLIKRFWSTIHPQLSKGDLDAQERLLQLEWIDTYIAVLLVKMPITSTNTVPHTVFSFLEWIEAHKMVGGEEGTEGLVEKIKGCINDTSVDFYTRQCAHLEMILRHLVSIERLVSEKLEQEIALFPNLRSACDQLDGFLRKAQRWSTEATSKNSQWTKTKKKLAALFPTQTAQEDSANFAFSSRQEAYCLLEQIASFLIEKDPHSPTPLLLRQAICWEHKTFSDIFAEMADKPQALQALIAFLQTQKEKEKPEG